ncbi:MAG: PSD1 and planctomycete cytochrome C domain-containing protein [Planctomycetota bacterium]|nr:PSD1 and planctomycete cytochrome C domain-containing protein [Planctomycetota bacterium]MDA1211500.1 PSD1 and planctomycete cytochrome C domain-containing protein [Planctomycetota bacterium]
MHLHFNSLRLLLILASVGLLLPIASRADDAPVFEEDVLPIFTRYCFNCHGKSSPQVGLELRTARQIFRGSQNGAVIVKGSLEKSLLWEKVSKREMPPALFNLKLEDAEIETVRQWILAGAPSDETMELPADVQVQFDRFENEIQPILNDRCVECHGETAPEAGLDLRNLSSLLRGSKKGPVIVEGFSDKSVLIRKLSSKAMPPPEAGEPLSPDEIGRITSWIDQGRFADFVDIDSDDELVTTADEITEEDRQFWAYQKPIANSPPNVVAVDRARTPIDRFVLAKLEAAGLTFSPDADNQTLLRRAYFDLTGLPPTPEQAQRFLADDQPNAYERLIDELLASPRYGERWGRHWLDVVGYVDTKDKDFDPNSANLLEGYWRFRDYVIASTNDDKPWNRFLVEQIAGDELVDWRNATEYTPEILELLTATGFLRNVLDATDEDISDLPFDRYEALFKLIERVSTSTMGMTMACARCHSHKFDPIPQTDYYRFLSLFTAAYNPSDWLPPSRRHLFDVSKVEQNEIDRQRTEVTAQQNELKKQVAALREPFRQQLIDRKLLQLPEAIRADTKTAVAADEKSRTEIQKYLAEKFTTHLTVSDNDVDASLGDADRKQLAELQEGIAANERRLASLQFHQVQALWDVGKAPTIRLLHRGDVEFAGPKVSPGFLSILSPSGQADALPSPQAVGETTGLRLAFAEWLTRPEHPLTARVIVNRMWQHHFGTGIVATPGNFGETGARPTHPELLDWLAVEFMQQGWHAKPLHKMIMLSTVYRQSSTRPIDGDEIVADSAESIDPQNRLLWRMNLQRLDAESIRDSVIAISGTADYKMGGPPVAVTTSPTGLQSVPGDGTSAASRRSIYLVARRSNPVTFLRVFDYPVIDVNCTQRSTSATPLQSLTMINSEFLAGSAIQFATRVEKLVGETATNAEKIDTAYWLAFSRSPSDTETSDGIAFLDQLEKLYADTPEAASESSIPPSATQRAFENFVHMLQCSNEFMYVD